MKYTVKQLANLAGVSARTLHYYDEIALLKPAAYGENGYRYYDDAAVLRLQQIMFYRELEFSLSDIQTILDQPDFDVARALAAQKELAETRAAAIEEALKQIAEAQDTLKALGYKKQRQRKSAEPAAADTPKRKRGSKTA